MVEQPGVDPSAWFPELIPGHVCYQCHIFFCILIVTSPLLNEFLLLRLFLYIVSVYYMTYVIGIIQQLSYYLNISVFTIPYDNEA